VRKKAAAKELEGQMASRVPARESKREERKQNDIEEIESCIPAGNLIVYWGV